MENNTAEIMAKIMAVSKAAWPTLWQRIMTKLGFGPSAAGPDEVDHHAQQKNWGAV